MAQIPTAWEFITSHPGHLTGDVDDETLMIEFAKMHVENFANSFNLSTDYRKHLVENYIKNIE
jgi:hypothetical protein